MWRLIGDASLLAFCTIHCSAPSSIRKDLPVFVPVERGSKLVAGPQRCDTYFDLNGSLSRCIHVYF